MKREKKQKIKPSAKTKNQKKNTTKNDNFKDLKFINVFSLSFLIILIGIISFGKYLSGEYLFFFKDIGSDSINQIYPGIVHKINLMSEGFFSKWSFYKGMGDANVTILNVEPYGILRQIIDYISAKTIGENYFVFYKFLMVFIYYLLFTGVITYFYFRTLSIKKFSAFLAALLLSFSGFLVVGSGWGFASHIFKAVFLLFAFEQLYLKKRWYFFPFAIIWLSTNVFTLYVYSLFLLLYSIFRYFSEKENKILSFLKLSVQMLLLGAVGLLMNFGQFLTSFQKLYNSPRVSGNASYSQILSGGNEIIEQTSIVSTTILRFFSSDILGTGSNFKGWSNYLEAPLFYIGLLTLLLFPQVFIYLNKRKKIVFGSFLGFWFLTLIFPYLRHAILAFTGDYFRYGFDFFIPFTLLFFAIYSLNQLDKNFKLNIALLGGTLAVLFLALFFPYSSIPSSVIDGNLQKTIVIILLLYSVLLFLMSKPKYKLYAQIGILLLVVIELSYFSYKSYKDRVPVTKKEFIKDAGGYKDGTLKAINYIKTIDKSRFYRIEKDYQSGNSIHGSLNDAKAQGYFGTASYSSFNQINYIRFLEEIELIQKGDETATRWVTGFRGYPLLQTFGNIKYHLSKSQEPDFLKFGFDSLSQKEGITILKNRFYLPFGYTYDKYIKSNEFKTLINYEITPQSLQNIYTELSRKVKQTELNEIMNKLQTVLNVRYSTSNELSTALSELIGNELAEKYKITISKYSVLNFKNQIALLSAFVYEKKFNRDININDFKEIKAKDSTEIIPAEKFNFEVYKNKTKQLKQDTLQITEFSNSNIKGNISLDKTKMLFFTIPFDEGWKIKVNGKQKKLQRINYGFTGISLPKGQHKIELYYLPQYSKLTNTVSLVSIIGFWLFLGLYIYRKKIAQKK